MNNNKETLSSICVEKNRELILNCELLPGEKIKGSYLKNYLGVGLSPIREALSRLSAIGIVELIDNIGFRVSQLSDESVLDFYVSYAMIEQLLFIESIKNHNDVWEANVVATLYQLAKLENLTNKVFYSKWSESNEKFHDALVSGACLNELMQIYKNLVIKKSGIIIWHTVYPMTH